MAREYSTYEAKAKFSEIIRAVREGQRVVIRYRGRPVAEVRPVEPAPQRLVDRLADLERRGVIGPAPTIRHALTPVADRPGALATFLEERD